MVISLVHADEQQMVAVVRSRRAEIFAIAINFSLISQSNDLFLLLRSFYLKRQTARGIDISKQFPRNKIQTLQIHAKM